MEDEVLKKKIKQCVLRCILLETVVTISMIVGGIYLLLSDRAWIGLLWVCVCVLLFSLIERKFIKRMKVINKWQ